MFDYRGAIQSKNKGSNMIPKHLKVFFTSSVLLMGVLSIAAHANHHKGVHDGDGKGAAKSEAHRSAAKERKAHAKQKAKDAHDRIDDDDAIEREREAKQASERHADGGSEKSKEMRARQQERQAIKEEYRANREPGQEGELARSGEKPVKKPWWKFWGAEE